MLLTAFSSSGVRDTAIFSFAAFASVNSAQFPASAVRLVVGGPEHVAAIVEAELSAVDQIVPVTPLRAWPFARRGDFLFN